MNWVIKYKTICASTPAKLDQMVNDAIVIKGFELYGHQLYSESAGFTQVVVKVAQDEAINEIAESYPHWHTMTDDEKTEAIRHSI